MEVKGPWDLQVAEQWLEECAMPIRLACTGKDGFPRVVSVWFLYRQGQFLSVSHRDSSLVRLLQSAPRVGFEVSPNDPPYHGVRGQGTASLGEEGAGEVLRSVIGRYLGNSNSSLADWLLSREDEEVLIRVTPQRFFTWDYRDRMEPATGS